MKKSVISLTDGHLSEKYNYDITLNKILNHLDNSPVSMLRSLGIALFGEVGTGKSTLGNTLLGGTSFFKESDDVYAETLETIACDGSFEGVRTHVMDSPGMGHSTSLDASHLVEFAHKLTSDRQLQALVMVFNFTSPRFEDREASLLRVVNNAFPGQPWYRHVAFVHTNFYKTLPPNKRTEEYKQKRLNGWYNKMHSYFPSIPLDDVRKIRQFFVDSIEARNPKETSASAIRELLAWVRPLKPLNEDLSAMNVPKGPSRVEKRSHREVGKTETHEWRGSRRYGFAGPRSHHGKTMQEQITVYEERTVQPMTAGPDQVVVDWHVVNRASNWNVISEW